ncbi:unnamed protein product, partial [Porites lobata]
MKTKQIDQLRRARTGLRGWMTRDFDAVRNIIESHSPEVERVEEKLDSIVARLQKAKDLQMEIEGLLNDDDEVQAEVDAQGSWFDMFVYLKSLLTGEAAGYVANFKTEEAN